MKDKKKNIKGLVTFALGVKNPGTNLHTFFLKAQESGKNTLFTHIAEYVLEENLKPITLPRTKR